ncbi:MAG TPA: hypothetical protein VKZ44_09275 [Taishania sp.]|nr:hypothetical protein [Taishania sp.]
MARILAFILLCTTFGLTISCKKDKGPAIEINVGSEFFPEGKSTIKVKEIWLNYATKKSNSEWMKLDLAQTSFDLAELYEDSRDTNLVNSTVVNRLQTLLKLRIHFESEHNSLITPQDDTLSITVAPDAIAGIKTNLNHKISESNKYRINLKIKTDSLQIIGNNPVFFPEIKLAGISSIQ